MNRHSQDKHTNNHGSKLIEICKNNNLFIVNGRFSADRECGKYTFRKTSVIDYSLVTADTFGILNSFNILDTDPIFSDGHCILSCTLFCKPPQSHDTDQGHSKQTKWNEKYAHNFTHNINPDDIVLLSTMLDPATPCEYSINADSTDHQERKCLLCTKDTVGDEFHYTLECPYFSRQRRALIPPQYYTRPNILKYQNLFSTCNVNTLTINLSKFVGIIMKSFI